MDKNTQKLYEISKFAKGKVLDVGFNQSPNPFLEIEFISGVEDHSRLKRKGFPDLSKRKKEVDSSG